jgi:hypothetical protein
MSATLIDHQDNAVTIQSRVPLSRSLLDTEHAIQNALLVMLCAAGRARIVRGSRS